VDRLSNLVSVLTVQVFKDEWTVRSGGITTPAQLLPFPTSSPAPALPHSNSVSSNQNGNSFSYLDRVPFSYTQNSTLPVSHPMSSAQVNVPQMSEPSQRRYPLAETWNVSPQHKNTFLPDFSVPSVQHQAYINNILICGTRTLDANRFAYQPR
jgi:hypothetical protein